MKYYIGPMSLNIVDAIINYSTIDRPIGLIPSRRQVDWNGGYVNNWTTETFATYVKERNSSVILQRDHGGPGQGFHMDDGLDSLAADSSFFDFIHIDPWKKYPTYQEGLQQTIGLMQHAHALNPQIRFEVGTEEAIRRFEVAELSAFIKDLKLLLKPEVFNNIDYMVVQSGVGLNLGTMRNTGTFNATRLRQMTTLCREAGLMSKEHNGDYLSVEQIQMRADAGLDAINIAPEFGQLETLCYLEDIDESLLKEIFTICHASKRWEKWVDGDFNPYQDPKKLIQICCHYVFSDPAFRALKPSIDPLIKHSINRRLDELHQI